VDQNKSLKKPDFAPSSGVLVKAVRRQLRPLVRILIQCGISYPVFVDMLKEIFVDIAERDFKLPEKQQTDSRLCLLTGIHRKDIRRLRCEKSRDDRDDCESASLGALLISRWLGEAKYLDADGTPKRLPLSKKQAGDCSFEGLVTSVNKDIRSRVILDEWLHKGVAHLDDDKCICLNTEAFVAEKGSDEKAYFFGENLHDHIAAASENICSRPAPFLERAVYYDELSEASVRKLAELSEEEAMVLLKKINQQAFELQKHDASSGNNPHRMRLGIYFYSTPDDDNSA